MLWEERDAGDIATEKEVYDGIIANPWAFQQERVSQVELPNGGIGLHDQTGFVHRMGGSYAAPNDAAHMVGAL